MESSPSIHSLTVPLFDPREVFAERVGRRKLVYLDQNVWIDLRDSATTDTLACLDRCHRAVADEKVVFPLAFPAVAEAVEISDVPLRLRHADLLDGLSNGVTFRSSFVLTELEAERAWRWFFAGEGDPITKEDVFTSIPNHLGEATMNFPEACTPEMVVAQMRHLRGNPAIRSVRFIAEQRDWGADHQRRLQGYAEEREAARQKRLTEPRLPKQQAFARALRAERFDLIDRFVVPAALKAVIQEAGIAGFAKRMEEFRAARGDGDDRRMKQFFARTPMMDQHARLQALDVLEVERRPQPQDFYDLEHGTTPPIFADVFVTRDRRLATLVSTAGRGKARVLTSLPELSAYLEAV